MARPKSTAELKDNRFVVMLTASEIEAIDDWMFSHRLRSRGEAIRQLVKLGMADAPSWKPMDSAPRDGTKILAWDARAAGMFMAVVSSGKDEGGWWTNSSFLYHHEAFSHWMPLPNPPEVSVEETAA